ncbi:hypothetical protein A2W13_00060 [Candidatus Woesebacteria bacterium RBG_16_36_11]|uniref:Uncharacterized protein n=2 Tax=Candidatus Woeseibacteriota TaxID=1752722 RepID=A0A1F7XCG9_9BACT|nr:MAG: hypothetical protein A2W13_00060 [Candidatus Woesebacteria bacterium RBG_16_36_11]OGM15620.1 MAG: hypothetical protein A2V55_02140 [Candidatus Woesebacteria bacterium RBG_19FT_COMBO_37_29]
MKKIFVVFVVNLLVLMGTLFIIRVNTKAQEAHTVYLPVIYKDQEAQEAIWVLNPELGEPQGWPGYLGETYTTTIDEPYPFNLYMVIRDPWYYILIGDQATVPPLGDLGTNSECWGVLVTEPWSWVPQINPIYVSTGYIVFYKKLVDSSLADPLIWAAQVREQVMQDMNCTNPDIGIYYIP